MSLNEFYAINALLQQQLQSPNSNHYALALGASRHQVPTFETMKMLQALYVRQGDKWIEVMRRLSETSPHLVIEAYAAVFELYRAFIGVVFNKNIPQGYQLIQEGLSNILTSTCEIQPRQLHIFYETFSTFLFQTSISLNQRLEQYIMPEVILFLRKYSQIDNQNYINTLVILSTKFVQNQRNNKSHILDYHAKYSYFYDFITEVIVHAVDKPSLKKIELLQCFTCSSKLYSVYFDNIDRIINDICFSALVNYNRDLKPQSEPQQVLNYESDLTGKRRSETLVTISTTLLLKLCEDIDGVLSKIFRYVLKIMDSVFTDSLTDFGGIISSLSLGQKIQLCYLILILICKLISDRVDLMQQIQQYKDFVRVHSKALFCLHYNWNLGNFRYMELFSNKQFEQSFIFILQTLRNNRQKDILNLQIYSSLEQIIENANLYTRIQNSIYQISVHLESLIEVEVNPQFFSMLSQFIERFNMFTEKYCVMLIKKLVNKIIQEINKCWKKNMRTSQLIVKCFNCLTAVLKKKDLIEELYQDIQMALDPLTILLSDPKKIEFQDRILIIGSMVVETYQQLTLFSNNCLKYLQAIYEKSKSIEDIFEFVYSCCTYAKKYIMYQALSVIDIFSGITLNYLTNFDLDSLSYDIEKFSKACILLQVILQNFEQFILDNQKYHEYVQNCLFLKSAQLQMRNLNLKQFDQILITLYYMKPFRRQLNLVPKVTKCKYANKMYLIYIAARLRFDYDFPFFQSSISFLKDYSNNDKRNMNMIEENKNQQHNYIEDFINSVTLPFKELNQVQFLQDVIKQLNRKKKIDYIELQQNQKNILKGFERLQLCGNILRKIYKPK